MIMMMDASDSDTPTYRDYPTQIIGAGVSGGLAELPEKTAH